MTIVKFSFASKWNRDAVNYLVDVGHIYSTIDENHYKSAQNYWKHGSQLFQ